MTRTRPDHHDAPADAAAALERLRADSGRVTRSRRELVEHFYGPGTSSATVDQLAARFPHFDQATLYRAVAALEEAGIVEHTHLGHGPAVYRRNGAPTVTAVCQRCGYAIDLPRAAFDDVRATVRRDFRFRIDLDHFAITGTCDQCAAASG